MASASATSNLPVCPTRIEVGSEAGFRDMLGHFASGVVVVTAFHQGEPVGITCQSFSSLSLDPPLVLFCVARSSRTWPRLRAAGHLAVNILHEGQEHVGQAFGRSSADKFAGVQWTAAPGGAPHLDAALGWIDCTLEDVHDGGDHLIAVARVHAGAVGVVGGPLVYFRGRYERLGVAAGGR
ncbi:flavin reductase family protein [Acidiferrimicrobium sp. IK]|uniref:flavin reductase family protein n=1 Tax=Acidiferrimicrobium sp. IK TaxID=2871700 RepID=UPI0021CB66ED|nr:flavin reductase family protein [Acidiferrimicrobium sp. IK]MCU4184216.1 flavin reductase family protein [Acidiferrimicrobium sp. IK]